MNELINSKTSSPFNSLKQNFYEKIIDFSPAMIYVKDLNGHFIYANKAFRDQFPNSDIIGKTTRDIVGSESADKIFRHDQEILLQKKEVEFREDVLFPEGKIHHLHLVRFPILDDKGEVAYIAGMTIDETKEVESRAKTINASKLSALGAMALEIGHEISNPLSVIKTSVNMLKSMVEHGETSQSISDRLQVVNGTVDRISEIIRSLKNLARNGGHAELVTCTVGDIVQDVRALSMTKFKMKGIRFEINLDHPLLDHRLRCARVQVSQVLLNLLVNAMDAVEGILDPWVKLEVSQKEKAILFSVSDNGPGVPKLLKEKIFEPFFTTKGIDKGTGLGLSISRNIMRKHGGDLYLDYEQGHSCFVVRLIDLKD